MEIRKANREWMSRPEDERFVSLTALADHCRSAFGASRAKVIQSRDMTIQPIAGDDHGLAVVGPNGAPVIPTHWAFGQLAQRAGAPAGYLRDLPAPLAADCLNFGLATREVEDVGVLLRTGEQGARLHAVTGPGYGRVWNCTIADALVDRFGDGVTGTFKVPGEFGKSVEVTKANTTLYASDRDMFVFLADEAHRIEVPDRRDGKVGSLARGFMVWNSEVGAQTFGVATFLFDYVCANRIIWGASDYKEIRIRHTSNAPSRWIDEVAPALERYAESETRSLTDAIQAAQQKRLGTGTRDEREEAVSKFLASRFTRGTAKAIEAAHLSDEGRPIETMWDAVVGATAYARTIPYQDERVKIEREAGRLM